MSTWTSKAVLAAALLLQACVAPGPAAAPSGVTRVLQGEIAVAGPRGYCADPEASGEAGESAVLLLGPCAGASVAPALITVTIGAPGSSAVLGSGAGALSDYFTSPAGRAALARDGRAGSVQVSQVTVADGALVLRLTDRAVGDHWRSLIGLRGRAVTISVTAPSKGELDPAESRRLLDRTIAALRRANPAT